MKNEDVLQLFMKSGIILDGFNILNEKIHI